MSGGIKISAAVASNTLVKTGIAYSTGGRTLGLQVLRVNGVTLAAGALAIAALWLKAA